jgi:hypothetical protein
MVGDVFLPVTPSRNSLIAAVAVAAAVLASAARRRSRGTCSQGRLGGGHGGAPHGWHSIQLALPPGLKID